MYWTESTVFIVGLQPNALRVSFQQPYKVLTYILLWGTCTLIASNLHVEQGFCDTGVDVQLIPHVNHFLTSYEELFKYSIKP